MGSNLELTKSEAIAHLNSLGASRTPFAFYCDFLGDRWVVSDDACKSNFQLTIGERTKATKTTELNFEKFPVEFAEFEVAFQKVVHEINYGNSFLTNLTFQTPIRTNLSLEEIYQASHAKYKLHVPNQFVVFSPETFVKIADGGIYSYPMKGTIDATIPYAREKILADVKETAEHVTIVDLIRNDLSLVADQVEVTRFRFVDEIQTNQNALLQVSSEIKGKLSKNWKDNVGTLLSQLIPAGSISGAPKPETIQIIQKNESYQRGFYTGICGQFDGYTLDTGVMIRFIKREGDQLFYCSGGGITAFSEATKEYSEMVDKIYLPI